MIDAILDSWVSHGVRSVVFEEVDINFCGWRCDEVWLEDILHGDDLDLFYDKAWVCDGLAADVVDLERRPAVGGSDWNRHWIGVGRIEFQHIRSSGAGTTGVCCRWPIALRGWIKSWDSRGISLGGCAVWHRGENRRFRFDVEGLHSLIGLAVAIGGCVLAFDLGWIV